MYLFLLLFIDLSRGDDFFHGLGIWTTRPIHPWKKRFLVPIPPVPREEDCVGMRFKDWGHWHDVPCDRPFISPYICEYGREYFLQQTKFCC